MCPHVAGAVRETRPAVPLVLGGWDRFKQPLTCGNSLLKGLGRGTLRVSQPSQTLGPGATSNDTATGRDTIIRMAQGCFVGYHWPLRGVGMGVDWHGQQ